MGRPGPVARWVGRTRGLAVAVGLAAPIVSGCGLLFGYPPYDEAFPTPSVVATYRTGSATIELGDGTTIELDRLADGATLMSETGTSVRWSSPDGWHVTLQGAGSEFGLGPAAYLQLDLVQESEHWTTAYDSSRCIVDVEVADESAVRGTATCRGVQWYDALDQGVGWEMEGPEALDEPEFDAEIAFEATP